MNGISQRFSAEQEKREVERIRKAYAKKVEDFGKFPGTHSLGAEFRTETKEK